VIVTATLYNTRQPYSTESADPDAAHIARYAWGDDYHEVIGRRLETLLEWMRSASADSFEARSWVDTGPVQERVYAQYAGLGWIGKNTCVINRHVGSWLLLGEIVCSLPLVPDAPALDQCGTCTLCIEACPTQAILGPGVLDSRRCLSYLTIEHRGPIPDEWVPAVGSHVYGCDVCQEVCPWNQAAPVSDDPAWQPRGIWHGATVSALSSKTDDELRAGLRGSAMRRTKVAGLRRNLAAACARTAHGEHARDSQTTRG
jgi:epoxyqueuosine reductase